MASSGLSFAGANQARRGKMANLPVQTLAKSCSARQKPRQCAGVTPSGLALTGVVPQFPGLLGLSRDYLVAQLGAWRTGERRAFAPDCMAEVARRLSPDDLFAVTAYLAAEPLPRNAHPVTPKPPAPPHKKGRKAAPPPPPEEPLPLRCGFAPPPGGAR